MQGASGSLVKAQKKSIEMRSTEADRMQISGCMDSEVSTERAGTGAMSFASMKALNENKNQDYTTLFQNMRQFLEKERFPQVPCLSAGRELILNHAFTI